MFPWTQLQNTFKYLEKLSIFCMLDSNTASRKKKIIPDWGPRLLELVKLCLHDVHHFWKTAGVKEAKDWPIFSSNDFSGRQVTPYWSIWSWINFGKGLKAVLCYWETTAEAALSYAHTAQHTFAHTHCYSFGSRTDGQSLHDLIILYYMYFKKIQLNTWQCTFWS